jgi:putative hydrolase of the HAD superfamily
MLAEALGRVVSFDALGTLLELEPPAPRLVAALAARGVSVTPDEAATAIAAEIAYYRAHHDEGCDSAALAVLRDRCADTLSAALPAAAHGLEHAQVRAALLEALRFRPYPDAVRALTALRARGHVLVVVSNWDVSLHEALAATGLSALVDAALSSAEAGCAKPSPGIFRQALASVGAVDEPATHVGDSLEHDVGGARAAGLDPVLVARGGPADAPDGVRVIASLDALVQTPRGGPYSVSSR